MPPAHTTHRLLRSPSRRSSMFFPANLQMIFSKLCSKLIGIMWIISNKQVHFLPRKGSKTSFSNKSLMEKNRFQINMGYVRILKVSKYYTNKNPKTVSWIAQKMSFINRDLCFLLNSNQESRIHWRDLVVGLLCSFSPFVFKQSLGNHYSHLRLETPCPCNGLTQDSWFPFCFRQLALISIVTNCCF
jgi:hypothetical protein